MIPRSSPPANHDLPPSVAEIANIIGREKALVLAGACKGALYVPKRLKDGHKLIGLIGEKSARELCKEWGGILLYIATCAKLRADWRNNAIRKWSAQGVCQEALAELAGLTVRHVANILSENRPQERDGMTAQDASHHA